MQAVRPCDPARADILPNVRAAAPARPRTRHRSGRQTQPGVDSGQHDMQRSGVRSDTAPRGGGHRTGRRSDTHPDTTPRPGRTRTRTNSRSHGTCPRPVSGDQPSRIHPRARGHVRRGTAPPGRLNGSPMSARPPPPGQVHPACARETADGRTRPGSGTCRTVIRTVAAARLKRCRRHPDRRPLTVAALAEEAAELDTAGPTGRRARPRKQTPDPARPRPCPSAAARGAPPLRWRREHGEVSVRCTNTHR